MKVYFNKSRRKSASVKCFQDGHTHFYLTQELLISTQPFSIIYSVHTVEEGMESVSLDLETGGPGANWEGTLEHENLTIKRPPLKFGVKLCIFLL